MNRKKSLRSSRSCLKQWQQYRPLRIQLENLGAVLWQQFDVCLFIYLFIQCSCVRVSCLWQGGCMGDAIKPASSCRHWHPAAGWKVASEPGTPCTCQLFSPFALILSEVFAVSAWFSLLLASVWSLTYLLFAFLKLLFWSPVIFGLITANRQSSRSPGMCALQRGAKERQGKWSSPSLALEDGSGLGLGVVDGTRGAWDVCFEWRSQSRSVRVCFVEPCAGQC